MNFLVQLLSIATNMKLGAVDDNCNYALRDSPCTRMSPYISIALVLIKFFSQRKTATNRTEPDCLSDKWA